MKVICFRKQHKERYEYTQYDRPNSSLDIKLRKLKVKVPEAMLYGCVVQSLNADRYNQPRCGGMQNQIAPVMQG